MSSVSSPARAGLRTGRPSTSAMTETELADVALPRPRRLAGRVTTRATACSWCSAVSVTLAATGVPKNTSRIDRPRSGVSEAVTAVPDDRRALRAVERACAELAERGLARVGIEAVEQEHAVEM